MQEMLNTIRVAYSQFSINSINLSVFWIVLFYLYTTEKKKERRDVIMVVILLLLMLLCPFSAISILNFGLNNREYESVFLVLPIVVVLAYGATNFWQRAHRNRERLLIGVIYAMILMIGSNFSFSFNQVDLLENIYRTSEDATEIRKLLEDKELVYVMAPKEMAEELRELDNGVRVFWGDQEKYSIINDIEQDWTDYSKIIAYSFQYGCNAIVLPNESNLKIQMEQEGYSYLGTTTYYDVFFYGG